MRRCLEEKRKEQRSKWKRRQKGGEREKKRNEEKGKSKAASFCFLRMVWSTCTCNNNSGEQRTPFCVLLPSCTTPPTLAKRCVATDNQRLFGQLRQEQEQEQDEYRSCFVLSFVFFLRFLRFFTLFTFFARIASPRCEMMRVRIFFFCVAFLFFGRLFGMCFCL